MASPNCDDPARASAFGVARSMPQSADEPPIGGAGTSRPTLVGASGDSVAFLDAPGLNVRELLDALDDVLTSMAHGAILTVFTDLPTAPAAAAEWCSGRDVELIAVIPHGARSGTTLTFRRAETGPGSAAPGLPHA